MISDRQGNRVSGATPEAIAHFDQALGEFNLYRGDPVASVDRALGPAPGFVMAHVLKAYLLGLATEPQATAQATEIVAGARGLPMDDRERSHVRILDELLRGNWTAAAVAMHLHNVQYPRDLLALQAGHLMDFFRASARDLRDRLARALPRWSASTPGHSIVLGMYAFGLEETGDYGRAEAVGREAIDGEPLDCWAHHAVAHVMEMQGRAQDGIGWMTAREPYWAGDDNFFKVHNWWHRALCHLDLGQADAVLRLYDGPIRGSRSVVAVDLVDASALLWRLSLAGHDVGVGTELREERELEQARRIIIETLAATFGQGDGGKLDVNNAGTQAIADRLRGPLAQNGVNLNEQQVQDLASAITRFRNNPPQSGLIRSFDQLAGVPGVNTQVIQTLNQQMSLAPYSIRSVEIVGPKMGAELRRQAIYVVLAALAGMLIYIAFRFEWIYGVAAVLAVFHDTVITIGLFSILDKEISLTVVAALLTLVGYSMNDTIVVFDRIRENLKLNRRAPYAELVNSSINQTLSRTVLTSGLTFLTAAALWLFGGPVLNGFALALVIGIVVGTYSSVFFASPIVVYWHNLREERKRTGGGSTPPAAGSTVRRTTAKAVR